jgi:lysophospholipase L1-like esterase
MKNEQNPSRRNFLKQASVLGATAVASPAAFDKISFSEGGQTGENYHFLFQGDSITDGNRSRNEDLNHVLGHGYAYLIAAKLGYALPQKNFHFFNRGVSGNQITDLARRWPEDTIALKPDLLSILIGVNDTMNEINGNQNSTIPGFERDYRALLTETIQQLPSVQLVIMEPFLLQAGRLKDNWSRCQEAISGRQSAAKKLADEFKAVYVPLQDKFTKAAKQYPPDTYWLWDGIHPMPNGHELIALEWIGQVSKKLPFIR